MPSIRVSMPAMSLKRLNVNLGKLQIFSVVPSATERGGLIIQEYLTLALSFPSAGLQACAAIPGLYTSVRDPDPGKH